MDELELSDEDVYRVEGYLNLKDIMQLLKSDIQEIKDPPWQPVTPPLFRKLDHEDNQKTIFDLLQEKEVLLHHPYESFANTVQSFLSKAAEDPNVLAIKQTLYRTAEDSPIIKSLVKAADNGKQVAVLVEIKARFDEANNIKWVHALEQAGCMSHMDSRD